MAALPRSDRPIIARTEWLGAANIVSISLHRPCVPKGWLLPKALWRRSAACYARAAWGASWRRSPLRGGRNRSIEVAWSITTISTSQRT